ncbi:MAG TPA: flavodoxin-dependent (E)-4-hydroxy-3-methylbut-2-enyl-diphosphate synthase, partial [Leptospiraceae bacterium]|nr:flavodoxin-dependent (E)-4-hydroxy-3-methylbut-2-enyl-diphosphate synthase [Leptospiraceae bacterium]
SLEEALYQASIHFGGLLLDGIGDALVIDIAGAGPDQANHLLDLSLDVLQATRLRLSKTEFISCPSCGRTLFDLQDTTARIQKRTGHLKGVKIAIMGCVVNGPGEMADADFGYVGAGPGKIHLYRGKEIVKKSIPSEIADEELVRLIQEHGMWVEPGAG